MSRWRRAQIVAPVACADRARVDDKFAAPASRGKMCQRGRRWDIVAKQAEWPPAHAARMFPNQIGRRARLIIARRRHCPCRRRAHCPARLAPNQLSRLVVARPACTRLARRPNKGPRARRSCQRRAAMKGADSCAQLGSSSAAARISRPANPSGRPASQASRSSRAGVFAQAGERAGERGRR